MKKLILTHGLVAGLILGLAMVLAFSNYKAGTGNLATSVVVGYAVMFLALISVMVIACLKYQKETGAFLIGKSMLLCLGIAGIASILYVISWALVNKYIVPDFADNYMASLQKQMEQGKISMEEFKSYQEGMSHYNEPLYFIGYTLMEILTAAIPSGLLVPSVLYFFRRKQG